MEDKVIVETQVLSSPAKVVKFTSKYEGCYEVLVCIGSNLKIKKDDNAHVFNFDQVRVQR